MGGAPGPVPLIETSVLDTDGVRAAIREHGVTGVVHLAARKAVDESVARPLYYHRENVGGLESLLTAMVAEDVERMVFSSSAAVYGMPDVDVVTEDFPPVPINPYGETKLAGEWLVSAVGAASGMRWVALRYFDVAGEGSNLLSDTGAAKLIPLVFRALDEGRAPQVFGDDYPTPDGSCIRDFLHVADLADTHVAAADGLWSYRRAVDPARVVASAAAIERDLAGSRHGTCTTSSPAPGSRGRPDGDRSTGGAAAAVPIPDGAVVSGVTPDA